MKQVMCTDEKCSIENMPKVNQRGRGSGLNPTGTPYLLCFIAPGFQRWHSANRNKRRPGEIKRQHAFRGDER